MWVRVRPAKRAIKSAVGVTRFVRTPLVSYGEGDVQMILDELRANRNFTTALRSRVNGATSAVFPLPPNIVWSSRNQYAEELTA